MQLHQTKGVKVLYYSHEEAEQLARINFHNRQILVPTLANYALPIFPCFRMSPVVIYTEL